MCWLRRWCCNTFMQKESKRTNIHTCCTLYKEVCFLASYQMVMLDGNAILQLCGVWCLLVEDSAPFRKAWSYLECLWWPKTALIYTESVIVKWWWELWCESMKKAGEEERLLAFQRDDFHEAIPAITVIVDGDWSEHSYNAKSGVGIITGKETN